MDSAASTARGWFAVAGRQASLPAQDKTARAFFLRWPRDGVLELGLSAEAVGDARKYVTGCLGEWGCPFGITEDMELICSELVSNALQRTWELPEPCPIGLRLLGNRQRVVLEVWDCHPGVPVRRVVTGEAECGRGLALVEELANRWGSRRLSAHVKTVWAELLLPATTTVSPGEGDAR